MKDLVSVSKLVAELHCRISGLGMELLLKVLRVLNFQLLSQVLMMPVIILLKLLTRLARF